MSKGSSHVYLHPPPPPTVTCLGFFTAQALQTYYYYCCSTPYDDYQIETQQKECKNTRTKKTFKMVQALYTASQFPRTPDLYPPPRATPSTVRLYPRAAKAGPAHAILLWLRFGASTGLVLFVFGGFVVQYPSKPSLERGWLRP